LKTELEYFSNNIFIEYLGRIGADKISICVGGGVGSYYCTVWRMRSRIE